MQPTLRTYKSFSLGVPYPYEKKKKDKYLKPDLKFCFVKIEYHNNHKIICSPKLIDIRKYGYHIFMVHSPNTSFLAFKCNLISLTFAMK